MDYINSNFRIKKYKQGYAIEIKVPRWTLFGIKYKWTHYISVSGISEEPWYFTTKGYAGGELLKHVKWDTIENS